MRGVFMLASCTDLIPEPSLSSLSLTNFAASLASGRYDGHRIENHYDAHVIVDDVACPTLCDVAVRPLNLTCHSAHELNQDPLYLQIVDMQSSCTECSRGKDWSPLLPVVLANSNYTYEFVWVFENDVAYQGDWSDLLWKYDNHFHIRHADMITASTPMPAPDRSWPAYVSQLQGDNWAGNLMDYARPRNASLHHAYIFASRFSQTLVNAAVNATQQGYWAYPEVFWPTICMATRCVTGTYLPEDTDLELWEPYPDQNQQMAVRDGLVERLLTGRTPTERYLQPKLMHPIKWESLVAQINALTSHPLVNSGSAQMAGSGDIVISGGMVTILSLVFVAVLSSAATFAYLRHTQQKAAGAGEATPLKQ